MVRLPSAFVLALAACLLAACGSDGGEAAESGSSGGTDSPSDSAAPAQDEETEESGPVSLSSEPFCDDFGDADFAAVPGLEGMELQYERKVGEKYEPAPGQPKVTSPVNACGWQSSDSGVGITVTPDGADAKALEESADFYRGLEGKSGDSDDCTVVTDPAWGEPTFLAVCDGRSSRKGIGSVTVRGIHGGDASFGCSVNVRGTTGADLKDAALELCSAALEKVST